ncbi:hypothetical protein WQ57_09580 [Mesobacillus campisalis]|uniref:Uncharacterized protein n=1 Tax=Mesobacillus campisalis TaxID=1408103 RepID=A0A0M2T0S3_9BACI|nr:hypothetical protein [Mesobacillus campisalis]KKK38425.1 hypothetical protein WQ57_09580 [Mesobacillus campisalis]
MGSLPAFHPEWLIRFWFGTPGLNRLDPHLTLALLAFGLVLFFHVKRRRTAEIPPNPDEERFKHLFAKQRVIERQLDELRDSHEQKQIGDELYKAKRNEFQKHLERTRQELRQFTL